MKPRFACEERAAVYPQSQASEYSILDTDADFWACAVEMVDTKVCNIGVDSISPSSSGSRSSNTESYSATSSNTSAPPPMLEDKKIKRSFDETSLKSNELQENRKKARIDTTPQLKWPSKTSEDLFINLSPPQLLQSFINKREIPYSILWELSRLVSKGQRSWSGDEPPPITIAELDNLQAKTNSDGIKKLQQIVCHSKSDNLFAQLHEYEKKATDPWPMLDKEETIALQSANAEKLDPERGRVHFLATLTLEKSSKTPKFELNAAKLGPSNSFSRHFGSKYFLRLTLSDDIMRQADRLNILDYLRKPVILCQNVFRAFYLKDQHVYYFKTNEVWDTCEKNISSSVTSGLSFMDFIHWHNPIERNQNQTMAKWASRFALGLSPSILGFTLEEENIKFIEDIRSANSDMTDGAGYITRALLQKLSVQHDWPNRPSAIQVRVRGSKGLLVEDPDINDLSLSIKLRPSLMKIDYDSPLDATHRTIDILRTAHARTPTRISTDVIINLNANGVKFESLRQLMRQSLDSIVSPLFGWCLEEENRSAVDEAKASLALWASYERAGSVIRSRRGREDAALARINGFSGDVLANEGAQEEGMQELSEVRLEDILERSTEWFPDRVSGCPSSLEETIIEFLDSGFHPRTCPVLREKMKQVVKSTVSRAVENYTIELPFSAAAWIIPDPSGRLDVNEVFFQCSKTLPLLNGTDIIETNIITGDVLITRDPCRLPTDVQKWKAVNVPELHQYKDVIILSVKGPRRAADWLAGGDYDGDKAKLIWQHQLVKEFRSADPNFADPPPDLDSYFETENIRAKEFLSELHSCSNDVVKIHKVQKYLLGTLKDFDLVGKYSNLHEISVYTCGYDSKEAKRLAYMFTTILDGRKTGKTVRRTVLEGDLAHLNLRLPWKETRLSNDRLTLKGNTPKARRNDKFIMEKLANWGKMLENGIIGQIEIKMERLPNEKDPALTAPYDEVEQRIEDLGKDHEISASMLRKDLNLIKEHVRKIFDRHKAVHVEAAAGEGARFTNLPIGQRQDVLRKLSRDFNSKPEHSKFLLMSSNDVERVKASYSYVYDWEHSHQPSRFPWNVAFRQLCLLKCGKDMKPVDRKFYDHMAVKLSRTAGHS